MVILQEKRIGIVQNATRCYVLNVLPLAKVRIMGKKKSITFVPSATCRWIGLVCKTSLNRSGTACREFSPIRSPYHLCF
jgi:hypothetical protein